MNVKAKNLSCSIIEPLAMRHAEYGRSQNLLLINDRSLHTKERTILLITVNYHEFTCGQNVVRCVSMA